MQEGEVRTSLWARLVVYYAKHMPEKLTSGVIAEVRQATMQLNYGPLGSDRCLPTPFVHLQIIAKYGQKEKELSARLAKKYFEPLAASVPAEAVQAARSRFGLADPEAATQPQQQQQRLQPTIRTDSPVANLQETHLVHFKSQHFNALLALNTPGVIPPIPNTRPLDNISAFRSLLPHAHPDYRDRAKHSTTPAQAMKASRRSSSSTGTGEQDDVDVSTATKPAASPTVDQKAAATVTSQQQQRQQQQQQQQPKAQQDPLQVVMALAVGEHGNGPISLLMRLYEENRRVCIMIRNVNSIRGVCTGLLKAFDKHFNVILTDVTEEYTITINTAAASSDNSRIQGGISGSSSRCGNSSRSDNVTTVKRQRYLKQLLIRGDNVVMCWGAAATSAKQSQMYVSSDSSSANAIT
jgi:small nuclear ribonucleoprotein (snRNP)-like protein